MTLGLPGCGPRSEFRKPLPHGDFVTVKRHNGQEHRHKNHSQHELLLSPVNEPFLSAVLVIKGERGVELIKGEAVVELGVSSERSFGTRQLQLF